MNSEFVTIRSLVVLLFLIGLPVVAIMPEGVQGALRGFWPEESPSAPYPPTVQPIAPSSVELAPVTTLADLQRSAAVQQAGVRPANFEIPADVAAASPPQPSFLPHNLPPNDPISELPMPSDRLTAPSIGSQTLVSQGTQDLQAELDQLGATYYRLESWGNSPRVYRFHCTVTITIGLAEYSRRFEATAEHPEDAMRQVLGEVQDWHDRFPSATLSEK